MKRLDSSDSSLAITAEDFCFSVHRPALLGKSCNFDYKINLQLFAAEDEGRTEPPSERRRREEREKGNVARSNELPAAVVLLAGVVLIYFLGQHLFYKSGAIMKKYIVTINSLSNAGNVETMKRLMDDSVRDIVSLLMPILGITFLAAIIANVAQVGFLFAPSALSMNFGRIRPNFKKVLPTRQTMFNLGKSILKVVLIGWITYLIIANDFMKLLLTGDMGLIEATRLIAVASFKIFLTVGLFLFAISIADYFYQKFEFEESLKMTPSEAKQEVKEQEGDRAILQRRRQLAREIANRGMIKKVPTADVIITNPTHYSIALAYDPSKHVAPVVVAKGVDEMALLIRRLAKKHNIPIVENRVQARLLYDEVEVDQEIPAKFFQAISLILASLDKYKRQQVA